jgi:hypothetical protein
MGAILQLYKKYKGPGAQKLLQLANEEGVHATSKDIKEFLSSKTEERQLKESRNTKQSHGQDDGTKQKSGEGQSAMCPDPGSH